MCSSNDKGGKSKSFLCAVGEENLCLDVIPWLKKKFDYIIVGGYSSPTAILAMVWLRLHRIPFYMEVDGGLIRQDGKLKHFVKKSLVCLANQWLSTGVTEKPFLPARPVMTRLVS